MTTFKGQLVLALVLNVGLKVLTFTLSTLLTRKLLPYQNGVYFTFNVYNDAVLFVAREATRNVASRLSILEEKDDEKGEEKQSSAQATAATSGSSSTSTKKVDVCAARKMVSVALCSVPLSLAAIVVLEVIGLCFGRISVFPSMLRHAHLSQQQQQAQHYNYYYSASLSQNGSSAGVLGRLKDTLDRLPMVLFPYLPELTVMGCTVLMALMEPCVVIVQSLNLFRVVVLAEFATLAARLVTVLAVVIASQRRGADAFQADGEPLNGNGLRTLWEARMALAFGQLAYAVTHVVYYAVVVSGLPLARWLGASAELQQVRVACLRESTAREVASAATGEEGNTSQTRSRSANTTPSRTTRRTAAYDAFAFPWCLYAVSDAVRECRLQAALLLTFLRESLLRLVLSEGESFALTSLGSEAARGYYQLIYSLGSLVARLLFRVWENACFVKWSREASLGHRRAAVQLLQLMLRLSFYVGFSFALLGPPLTRTFLKTMYTSRWATPQVTTGLQLCFYGMPLMAWNGLLEAFLRAVASPAVLQRLQRWMVGETVVYIAACYVTLLSFGKEDEQGNSVSVLVLLNTVNMLWRCGASVYLLVTSPSGKDVDDAAAVSTGTSPSGVKQQDNEGATSRGDAITTAAPQLAPSVDTKALTAHSMVRLHEFAHLFSPSIAVALCVLFVVSRVVTASLWAIALVGVAYGVVILAGDAEVRRLLLAPVLTRVNALLLSRRRQRSTHGPTPSATTTVEESEKKQQ